MDLRDICDSIVAASADRAARQAERQARRAARAGALPELRKLLKTALDGCQAEVRREGDALSVAVGDVTIVLDLDDCMLCCGPRISPLDWDGTCWMWRPPAGPPWAATTARPVTVESLRVALASLLDDGALAQITGDAARVSR